MTIIRRSLILAAIGAAALPVAAQAQEQEGPRRVRVALGAAITPAYPGADDTHVIPWGGVSITRKDQFEFSAPDQGFGFALVTANGLSIGPVVGIQGERKPKDVGAAVPKVKTTYELGGFVQYAPSDNFRLRAEARRGVNGHKAWVGSLGADFVTRDRDEWLFSVGPRLGYASNKFHDAYYSVTPATAAATGLPVFNADGGIPTVGVASSAIYSLGGRWGLQGYGKYDRLVGDAKDSPIVRSFGSRNQFSAGAALTYTFGG